MARRTVRKVLRAAVAAAALYAAWLAYSELSFRTYRDRDWSGISSGPPLRELQGIYHVHTSFSDGHATVDEIAALAARQGLDFVVLTDHGNPNHASLRAAGRRKGVLVLAGSELNVNRGHLVALGFRSPPGEGKLPSIAEDAVAAVKDLGGFAVIAHPYSKVKWSWGDWGESSDYSGIEIVNADTMFKNNYRRVLAYAPLLLLGSRLPLVKMLEHPASNLERWDKRGEKAPIAGYFSADAHLYYRGIFGLLRLHVLVDRPDTSGRADRTADESAIWDALRHGRFYNAVEAVADASGFRFEAFDEAVGPMRADLTTRPRLSPIYGMGDTIVPGLTAAKRIRFRVLVPHRFRKEIRLLRDGRVIAATDGNTLDAPSEGPGVYRVEVYLRERTPLGKDIPWIVSNPIYVRKD